MKKRLIVPAFLMAAISFAFNDNNRNDTTCTYLTINPGCPLVRITAPADSSPVVADGAELQKISSQFKFTEGPAADKKGNVYFTDQPNDNIWKYDTKGNLTLFMSGA